MAITFVGADASSSVNVTAITGLAWPDTNNDDLAVFLGLAIIAVLSHVTALQRFFRARGRIRAVEGR